MRREEWGKKGRRPTGKLCWKTTPALLSSCGSSRSAAGSFIKSVRRHHSLTQVDLSGACWGSRGQSSIRPLQYAGGMRNACSYATWLSHRRSHRCQCELHLTFGASIVYLLAVTCGLKLPSKIIINLGYLRNIHKLHSKTMIRANMGNFNKKMNLVPMWLH